MTKKETKIVEWALDELMKGDDGNTGNIVYKLGLLVGRTYPQFAQPKKKITYIDIRDLPLTNMQFKAPK